MFHDRPPPRPPHTETALHRHSRCPCRAASSDLHCVCRSQMTRRSYNALTAAVVVQKSGPVRQHVDLCDERFAESLQGPECRSLPWDLEDPPTRTRVYSGSPATSGMGTSSSPEGTIEKSTGTRCVGSVPRLDFQEFAVRRLLLRTLEGLARTQGQRLPRPRWYDASEWWKSRK